MSCLTDSTQETTRPITVDYILSELPFGVVLLDDENVILWANNRFLSLAERESAEQEKFYEVLKKPEVLGPDFTPFNTALVTGKRSTTRLQVREKLHFQMDVTPIVEKDSQRTQLIVVVRDITDEVGQQQKFEAIHKAGIEMTNVPVDDVTALSKEERVELLKADILYYTQDVLEFNVIEIRLLDESTGNLRQLLAEGIDDVASDRTLLASTSGNGITGFVAATGESYLCEDTLEDPLYLEGFPGARSSMTVPLKMHEQVIGTFNVESPEPRAFNEHDLMFLEMFAREVAVALNTLELLAVQDASVTLRNLEQIHGAVALPIDQILNEAVYLYENFDGNKDENLSRLRSILKNARDIRETIQKVGYSLSPVDAVVPEEQAEHRRKLHDCHVLVVDEEKNVRVDAHRILEKYGCIVDSARSGGEAISMVRCYAGDSPYDVILSDITLPDMHANVMLEQLKTLMSSVPLALMKGFGYDPNHTVPKCKDLGFDINRVLSKPFRLDQMLNVIENVVDGETE